MRIEKLRIKNYKSFAESPEMTFTSGFNVIAGQNSSGKTALLEILGLAFGPNPHQSLETKPTRETILNPVSTAEVSITLHRDEFLAILASMAGAQLWIALPALNTKFTEDFQYRDNSQQTIERLVQHVLTQQEHTFSASLMLGGQAAGWHITSVPSNQMYEAQIPGPPNALLAPFTVNREGKPQVRGGITQMGLDNEFGTNVMAFLPARIFRFAAERLNIGTCPFGPNTLLNGNASNLAEVLVNLQYNPSRFREFNRLVHQILPQVQQVTVRPIGGTHVQIIVWPHDPESQREDIALPLEQCGTGIGQVLAILYVAIHAPFPRVILIDEPQSFLHPGAVKKLIEVLANYRQHQFIISTHSPTAISAADPQAIIVTRLDHGVTNVDQVRADDNRALQLFLSEIGLRFSDVFGADNLLWVEGSTEENCFPMIVREVAKRPLMGTAIVGVKRTGDLETKDAARIFEIYDSLASAGTLTPPAIGFVLDSECRSENEQNDIIKRSRGTAAFLPRRMYENYLLNPAALAHVMSASKGFREQPISSDEIIASLDSKRSHRKYYCPSEASSFSSDWLKHVHGAMLLRDLFREFSEARVEYDKVIHGAMLTRWLVRHSPEDLREITDLLAATLDKVSPCIPSNGKS